MNICNGGVGPCHLMSPLTITTAARGLRWRYCDEPVAITDITKPPALPNPGTDHINRSVHHGRLHKKFDSPGPSD